ncbi:thioredoxin-like protein [Xylona heveae TC161]|uniref:Thioredoxin-like protein n=1 Tax=Xylona heveae (strain CBS 132557 / TC161) TaxID=1328760 RepID=A0A165JTG1_XYLHT|nr:thioredoxin-like protein [Xylona heveae TC161]KZF26603.1 thioredoxin-like protein [Xylona heveae TC161]
MSAAENEAAALFNNSGEKLSTHPEDAGYESSGSEPSSDKHEHDYNDEDLPPDSKMGSARFQLPSKQFNANTGPKGVISDAQAFEQAKRSKIRMPTMAKFRNQPFETSRTTITAATSDKGSEDESMDEDEEEFMRSWREKRLNEIRSGSNERSTRRLSPSKRRFGSLDAVDADGYLDAVEKISQSTVVAVCIYDDQSEVSGLVEDCLMNLARKHDTTRFIKLHYEEAEMDPISVPAVLAYHNGELFANLVSIIDEIPADRALSPSSLEGVLRRHNVV